MNKMEEITKMFGVELEKEFKLTNVVFAECAYRFTDEGLEVENGDVWERSVGCVLERLLTGDIEIVKKPWKPTCNRYYWHVEINGEWFEDVWEKNEINLLHYKIGNCFKYENEITPEIIEKFVAFYKSDEQIEI